jgi:hypothetical protein
LANSDDDTVLKALIDIAENTAKYLRPAIDEVFNLCLEVRIIWIVFARFFHFSS